MKDLIKRLLSESTEFDWVNDVDVTNNVRSFINDRKSGGEGFLGYFNTGDIIYLTGEFWLESYEGKGIPPNRHPNHNPTIPLNREPFRVLAEITGLRLKVTPINLNTKKFEKWGEFVAEHFVFLGDCVEDYPLKIEKA